MGSFSREWPHSLENELILWRMSTKSLQNNAKRPQIVAERSFSREWTHSLENEHQIVAERSKITPNRCSTQQNGPKLMQNAAKRQRIVAERSSSREWAHSLENERSASIWLKSFLFRSALIRGRFLRSALGCGRFAAFCNDLVLIL